MLIRDNAACLAMASSGGLRDIHDALTDGDAAGNSPAAAAVVNPAAQMFLFKSLSAISLCQDPRVSEAVSKMAPEAWPYPSTGTLRRLFLNPLALPRLTD